MIRRSLTLVAVAYLLLGSARAQTHPIPTSQVSAFLGTWVIEFTEPPEFKATQTLRIWDVNGAIDASIQTAALRPQPVTGILKDGDMLVLTINRNAPSAMRENGVPIWSVMSVTLDGESMKAALMLEQSRTIKRGIGKKP